MTRSLAAFLVATLGASPLLAQRQPTGVTPRGNVPLQSDAPKTAFDTTVAAISTIGTKVAEVRGAYELYRRAAFNEPDGAVLQRGRQYQESCLALAAAVREAEARVRPATVGVAVRPSVQRYRGYLPSLARVADRCAGRIRQMRARRTDVAAAKALRDGARGEGRQLAIDLRTYELRLRDVRHAMGWDQRGLVPTARPSN